MSGASNGRGRRSINTNEAQWAARIKGGPTAPNPSPQQLPARRLDQPDVLKSLTRKSIEVALTQGIRNPLNTHQPQGKPYYRRLAQNFRKQGPSRYEEQENGRSAKSPYNKAGNSKQDRTQLNKSSQQRAQLNKSSQKIRSGQLLKQNSPRYFYRQPRSSLSQHHDPSIEVSLHKRKVSAVGDQKSSLLEEAKELYRGNEYARAVEVLRRLVRGQRGSVEGHYLLGMSLVNSGEFNLGIDELLKTLQLDAQFKRSLYLVIALAYKRLTKFEQAIQILTKGIELYPDYYDCLVYRGKLLLKRDNYQQALQDFTEAVRLNPAKGFAYIGKGTCEKELGRFSEAILSFTAGANTDMGHICVQKRGIVQYQQGRLDEALRDLQFCCGLQGNQSASAHYYRGLVCYRKGRVVDALLSFEEALKCDNHRESVTGAVEMMMKIKVEEKDFYEAYHVLSRADNVDADTDVLNEWRLFLEASLFLMKKKYKEGVAAFESLLGLSTFCKGYESLKSKAKKQRYQFLKPLIHLYKAYGQLCENKTANAAKEYEQYEQLCREFAVSADNLSKDYNKLLMRIYKQFPTSARDSIEAAIKLIPSKPEPYLYLAFELIQNSFENTSNPIGKNSCLEQAIANISTGIGHLPQLSNNHISTFYYFRSILELYRSDFNGAVGDVDKAIEKSEDNIPKYFYLRGLVFAVFGNFGQAVQDLTVAINLDEKYAKPYLERAKCLQIEGNSNQAFLDLQRYITLAPDDQQIHKYAGYLLFQNCAYEDCLAAFSHGKELQGDFELTLTKAKCHFLLGEDELAVALFRKYGETTFSQDYDSDVSMMEVCRNIRKETTREGYGRQLDVLDRLISCKREEDCKIFKLRDMHQLKASIYLILGEYETSIAEFQKTLELFSLEKAKEREKHFIEDSDEFEDEWSEVEIKFNLSLCLLCQHQYERARDMLIQFQKSSEKGKNWNAYMDLIDDLACGQQAGKIALDTFEQNHRISKLWPKIDIPATSVCLSMAFSYPFVEPPELLPEFDESFFDEFMVSRSEQKPEAPWINRSEGGLVFTPNVQVFQNLQLSMTTTKKNDSERNKPVSEMEKSVNLSQSEVQLESEDLKRKFKLDSLVEMRLKKLMKKA